MESPLRYLTRDLVRIFPKTPISGNHVTKLVNFHGEQKQMQPIPLLKAPIVVSFIYLGKALYLPHLTLNLVVASIWGVDYTKKQKRDPILHESAF